MLDRVLASVGIGAAKVDTRVRDTRVRAGETLSGEIHLQGGNVDQEIAQIYMVLAVPYTYESGDHKGHGTHEWASFRVTGGMMLRAGERKVVPFQLTLPYDTPITIGRQKVYLNTGLDIAMALDPKDADPLVVSPDPLVEAFLSEADCLGFRHTYESGTCHRHGSFGAPRQEFEMKPTGAFRGDLDELELTFRSSPDGVEVLVQVDRKARGLGGFLAEAMDMDERYLRASFRRGQGVPPGALESIIRQGLGRR